MREITLELGTDTLETCIKPSQCPYGTLVKGKLGNSLGIFLRIYRGWVNLYAPGSTWTIVDEDNWDDESAPRGHEILGRIVGKLVVKE